MLARPALDRDLHRALVDAGYAPLHEYVGRYDMSEDVPATADPVGCFTLVFEGDIRQRPANPFNTDTPFGRPMTIAVGDVTQQRDELEEANAALVAENDRLRETLGDALYAFDAIVELEFTDDEDEAPNECDMVPGEDCRNALCNAGGCLISRRARIRAALGDKP